VPDAPAVEGDEQFVDLPAREEGIPEVAGLNPGPAAAGERPRIALTGGRATRVAGRPGLYFQINYRFEKGAPAAGQRYSWVIATARGRAFKLGLSPGALQAQGTLSGHLPFVAGRVDAPYRTYLILDALGQPGGAEEKISEELTIR
jgi:hypothetical protein